MRSLRTRGPLRSGVAIVVALAASSLVVAILEHVALIPNAAAFYLLAVLGVALVAGTVPAVLTAIASTLLYDYFFVEPIHTFTVADPLEWLNLLLFLAVGVAIGQLAAMQAARTKEAADAAREAQSLFRISRSLSASDDLAQATGAVLGELAASTAMDRIWLGLGATPAAERIVADTSPGSRPPSATWQVTLQRRDGDEPARWTRSHVAVGASRLRGATARGTTTVYRIRVEVAGQVLGSLWALRARDERLPDRAETRILSAAADQLGQGVHRERLAADALEAEVARRSDALKTALLDSVSHDLRTPLATIRATAGSMLDPEVPWSPEERDEGLRSIDAQADRMDRLVHNLLDLSRIEGGALRPEMEPHDLDELVERVLRRIPAPERSRVATDIPVDLPPVLVDDTYIDEVLTNLLDNAIRYGGPHIRVLGREHDDGSGLEIVVEDDGAGVPEADLGHLFEKFYRAQGVRRGQPGSMGIGLTVVSGLVRAMGGELSAGRGELGGLAIRIVLPAARLPAELARDIAPVAS